MVLVQLYSIHLRNWIKYDFYQITLANNNLFKCPVTKLMHLDYFVKYAIKINTDTAHFHFAYLTFFLVNTIRKTLIFCCGY